MPALLEAKALHAAYGETRVLHGIDFSVEEGGVTALLGANGAGKTTTLRAICGMVRTQGDIILGGEAINGMATEDVVRRGVAHVPDGRGTFMELTVEENILLPLWVARHLDRRARLDFLILRLQPELDQAADGSMSATTPTTTVARVC